MWSSARGELDIAESVVAVAEPDTLTARIARGLEPAMVDHERVAIGALEPSDARTFDLGIAGPSALLVAKVIKIIERLARQVIARVTGMTVM